MSSKTNNLPLGLDIVHDVLADRSMRFLNASVLVYAALLPFNAFGFVLPLVGRYVKYTELALVFVVVCGVIAYLTGHIRLKEAFWLYVFLAINILAQILSVVFAPYPVVDLGPAIAAAQYSVLVFVLMHAFHSERLIQATLVVMGWSVMIVAVHSVALYIMQGGIFLTREQPSIVGTHIGNYLGYLLLMFGVGVTYLYLIQHRGKWLVVATVAMAIWLFSIVISGIKMSQIGIVVFLALSFVLVRGTRWRVIGAIVLFLALFGLQFNVIHIQRAVGTVRLAVYERQQDVRRAIANVSWDIQRRIPQRIAKAPKPTRESARASRETASPSLTESPQNIPVDTTTVSPLSPSPAPSTSVPKKSVQAPTGSSITPPFTVSVPSMAKTESSIETKPMQERPVFIEQPPPEIKTIKRDDSANFLWARWIIDSSRSFELRMRGMQAAVAMGMAHPLTGVGPGQQLYYFDHFSELVRERAYLPGRFQWILSDIRKYIGSSTRLTISATNPNNFLLMVWAETGLIGLVAIFGIFGCILFDVARALWHTRKRSGVLSVQVATTSFAGLMLFQLVNPFMLHPWFWTTLALLSAASYTVVTQKEERRTHEV